MSKCLIFKLPQHCLIGIAWLFLASVANSQQIHKCVNNHPDGTRETVLSDIPCAGDSETYEIKPSISTGASKEHGEWQRRQYEKSVSLWAAAEQGRVLPGMNERQVRRAWGRPTVINRSARENRRFDQWVYRGRAKTSYVYFSNGAVTSVDN